MALAHPRPDDGNGGQLGLQAAIDELYGGRPEQFTSLRDRLARRLRAAGRGADADGVKALRRPSRAAWALNTVARTRPDLLAGLLDAARALRVAHDEELAGLGTEHARAAQAAWRRHVLDVVGEAQHVLATVGAPVNAHVATLTALVEAAAAEPDLADALRDGRLHGAELDPADVHAAASAVTPIAAQRTKVVRAVAGSAVEQRRAEERERLGREVSSGHRRLSALRAQHDSAALEEAACEERVAEARRRLETAEAALRSASIERHRTERELLEATRAARHLEERAAQLDELMAPPPRHGRPT